jgi:hypothetical protein
MWEGLCDSFSADLLQTRLVATAARPLGTVTSPCPPGLNATSYERRARFSYGTLARAATSSGILNSDQYGHISSPLRHTSQTRRWPSSLL